MEQLIAVFVAVVAEPCIRWIKGKFNLSGPVMLLVTAAVAGLGAVVVVLIDRGDLSTLTLDDFLALVPTIFAVGQVIYGLL